MELRSRKGVLITSLDEWATLASPAAVEHWKPARSAHELARDWTEGDAEQAFVALLSTRPEFVGIELRDGIAESARSSTRTRTARAI